MKFSLREILSIALDIGEEMLKCGAEISKVEESMQIICKSYGVKYMETFAMNSLIVVTLRRNDESVTESRRIRYHINNLYRLEKLNDLSRNICNNNISRDNLLLEIQKIKEYNKPYVNLIGSIITAFSFTVFFGGNIKDGICSALISIIIFLLSILNKKIKINNLIHNFLCSFLIGVFSIILTKLGLGTNFDKIIIGNIMLLIPGLLVFISINDIFKGDTMSGIGKFTEGIFLAFTIAAGTGFSLFLLGGIL